MVERIQRHRHVRRRDLEQPSVLVGEGGIAGDDEKTRHARQFGRQIFGKAVGVYRLGSSMRYLEQNGGLKVRAITGTRSVLLAFDADEQPRRRQSHRPKFLFIALIPSRKLRDITLHMQRD